MCSHKLLENHLFRGRFAPSPTGHLHFGSLIAAVASFLDARSMNGEWLVRMEDVDATRNVPGAAEDILASLEAFGFEWDGPVLWQSTRAEAYAEALERLKLADLAYGCCCSRKEVAALARQPAIDGGLIYPGSCRNGMPTGRLARAWRMQVDALQIDFVDRLQGRIVQQLERDVGDFVLLRADGLFAYQLAVTVDDHFQGISHIVRGADLLDSTPRQIWLQSCLGYTTPSYAHLPVASNAAGEKLSKQTLAQALEVGKASMLLVNALRFLGQPAPLELQRASLAEVWSWARAHWDSAAIPPVRTIRLS